VPAAENGSSCNPSSAAFFFASTSFNLSASRHTYLPPSTVTPPNANATLDPALAFGYPDTHSLLPQHARRTASRRGLFISSPPLHHQLGHHQVGGGPQIVPKQLKQKCSAVANVSMTPALRFYLATAASIHQRGPCEPTMGLVLVSHASDPFAHRLHEIDTSHHDTAVTENDFDDTTRTAQTCMPGHGQVRPHRANVDYVVHSRWIMSTIVAATHPETRIRPTSDREPLSSSSR
jgi:hypothetical protein